MYNRATDKGHFVVFTNYLYRKTNWNLKKTSYKTELKKEKLIMSDPNPMALVFLDRPDG